MTSTSPLGTEKTRGKVVARNYEPAHAACNIHVRTPSASPGNPTFRSPGWWKYRISTSVFRRERSSQRLSASAQVSAHLRRQNMSLRRLPSAFPKTRLAVLVHVDRVDFNQSFLDDLMPSSTDTSSAIPNGAAPSVMMVGSSLVRPSTRRGRAPGAAAAVAANGSKAVPTTAAPASAPVARRNSRRGTTGRESFCMTL
jgi:hypothetical protein